MDFRTWAAGLVLAAAVAGGTASAAPSAEPPPWAPATPVTLVAIQTSLDTLLARLSEQASVKLTLAAPLGPVRVTLRLHACPLRDAMGALAAVTGATWHQAGQAMYRLQVTELSAPPMETPALIGKLAAACPWWMKPTTGPAGAGAIGKSPPVDLIYASLQGAALATLEEGGEVPFSQLPSRAQGALLRHVRERAREEASSVLRPAWWAPAERLGLRFSAQGASGRSLTWQMVRRTDGGPWEAILTIPYQPRGELRESARGREGSGQNLRDAALHVAQRAGVSVVVSEGGGISAREPSGTTGRQMLDSLLPETGHASFLRFGWRAAGTVYWLDYGPAGEETVDTPELQKSRGTLERALPVEYHGLFGMDARQRSYALAGLWAKLWESLTWEQQTAGEPLPVATLTTKQQDLLVAALQAGAVERVWSILEGSVGEDLRGATVSLDFGIGAYTGAGRLGIPRLVRVREGERVLLVGVASKAPLMLRLLPCGEAALQKSVDLVAQNQPLDAVLSEMSDRLGALVAAEEPEKETKLTAEFRGRPLLLLLHWIERHTGLVWSKAGSAYVLSSPPAVATLVGDPGQVARVLGEGIPEPASTGTLGAVAEAVTGQDRALLGAGDVRLGDLSTGLQAAIEDMLAVEARQCLASMRSQWEVLNRLDEAQVTVRAQASPAGTQHVLLRIEVPGLPPVVLQAGTGPGAAVDR